MKRRAAWPRWLLALAALAGGAGCKQEASRSLLPIDVTAADDLTDLRRVKIAVARAATVYVDRTVDWSGPRLQVAFHLPADVDGKVTVTAEGLNAGGMTITATAMIDATVSAGATATAVQLRLVRGTGGGGADGGAKPDGAPVADGPPAPDEGASDAPPASDTGGVAPSDAGARTWHPGENLQKDDLHGSVVDPDVAIDPAAGHVLAAWAGGGVVTCRRFDGQTQTWGTLTTVDSQGDPQGARVALGPNGRALLVWYQYSNDGTAPLRGLWESHSSDGGKSWSKAMRVHMEWVFAIELAMSSTGEARIAWEVHQTVADVLYPVVTLWSGIYQASTGTFANLAAVVPGGKDTTDREPRIVIDGAGNGILAWQQLDTAGQESVWATGFSGAQPLKPQLLEANTTERLFSHNAAMAPEGHRGLVVWSESEGVNEWLVFDEYEAGLWKGPHRELSGTSFAAATAVIDHAGIVTVAWPQSGSGYNAAAARRTPGSGWGPPALLEDGNLAKADERPEPQLAVDGQGAVHAAWRRKVSTTMISFDVVVRRFANGGWEPATVLGHKDTLRTYHPRIVAGDDGRAAAAFYFFSGRDDPASAETEGYRTFVGLYR